MADTLCSGVEVRGVLGTDEGRPGGTGRGRAPFNGVLPGETTTVQRTGCESGPHGSTRPLGAHSKMFGGV